MLDPTALASSFIQIELDSMNSSYTSDGQVIPLTLDAETQARITSKCTDMANAIHQWILNAEVNTTVSTSVSTTHAPGSINVVGTAAAQSNVAPVVGTGTGSGNGTGFLS
jgi:hypothetical protein